MQYAMLFGHLPFWGDTEEEFIDKIVNSPLKFDADVPLTDECKEVLKSMLQKSPEKRADLITLIQNDYFIIDEEELEDKIKLNLEHMVQLK